MFAPASASSTPAFDPTQLLLLMQDSPEQRAIVLELLDTVLKNGTASLEAALQSWQAGNTDQAARQLHTVRGTLGSFGLRRFAAVSLVAEQALLSFSRHANAGHPREDIGSLLDAALQALRAGLDDMRTWLTAHRLSMP